MMINPGGRDENIPRNPNVKRVDLLGPIRGDRVVRISIVISGKTVRYMK